MVLCFSQRKVTIVKANSNNAKIYEEDNRVSGWGINPKVNPDTHTTGKITKRKKSCIQNRYRFYNSKSKAGREKRLYCTFKW
ncbi:hypothetical protein NV63_17210 [Elizabethkingia anophelis]|nr:hypothetical protein NV63_17210 [Elizabethkingia anophelis]